MSRWSFGVAIVLVAQCAVVDRHGVLGNTARGLQAGAVVNPVETLPGEWILPRFGADVAAAVQSTLDALGLRVDYRETEFGIVVTAPARYDAARWPSAAELGLAPVFTPKRATFHIHVAPGFEPARLAVGVVIDADHAQVPLRPSKRKGTATATLYSNRPLGAFFVEQMASRLGATAELLAADPAARAAQAGRLLPPGIVVGCGVRVAPLVAPGQTPVTPTAAPKRKVLPAYPEEQMYRGVGGAVQVRGEVTEHGTLTRLARVGGVTDSNLVAASFGAAGLWRFKAPTLGECPARGMVTLELSFGLARR